MAQDWHWIGQLALDWPIGTGLADWHRIDQVLEIGELILDQKVDL